MQSVKPHPRALLLVEVIKSLLQVPMVVALQLVAGAVIQEMLMVTQALRLISVMQENTVF